MKAKEMMKKLLAAALSATMVFGMTMTAFAGSTGTTNSGSTTIDVPIYSMQVLNVVVPANFEMAFNPDEFDVQTVSGGTQATVVSGQVVSRNYGIMNKSTKDMVVNIEFDVNDQNNKIEFTTSAVSASNVGDKSYAMYLATVPASGYVTNVVTGASTEAITVNTSNAQLSNVEMDKLESAAIALKQGKTKMAFKLNKATYAVSGDNILLGETAAGSVGGMYKMSQPGQTAGFTFTGAMNKEANWSALTSAVKITATYNWVPAEGNESVVNGTCGLIEELFTSSEIGVINFKSGEVDSLVSVTAPWDGEPFDVEPTLDKANSKITVNEELLGGWAENGENPVATITYKKVSGGPDLTATCTLITH